MGSITLNDVVPNTLTDAAVMNNNNNALRGAINGGIDNSNIASNAQIAVSKLNTPGGTTEFLRSDGSWAAAVPSGCILPFAGSAAPSGWLVCDGTAVSQSTYAALYAVIGVTYGNPGSGNFNLPDLRGRVAVGQAPGGNPYVDALGDSDGIAVGSRSIVHRHSVTDPGHYHQTGATNIDYTGSNNPTLRPYPTGTVYNTSSATTGVTVGPAGYPQDMPAYLTLAYIIKT
jgi:microcystin-dependent protein